jgi:hypothetical protein
MPILPGFSRTCTSARSYNPNPKIDVGYGAQSTDEMAVSFMGFVIDPKTDPTTLFPRRMVREAVE